MSLVRRSPAPSMPATRITLAALVAVVCGGPAAAAAQEAPRRSVTGPAWLGVSYDMRWVQVDERCEPQVYVDGVVQGSPAERAGLRPGEVILALDGQPLPPARLEILSARLNVGDSVRLRIAHDGRPRDITAVADRRPARPPVLVAERAVSPGGPSDPVLELRGDTLVARNIESLLRGGRGYWLATPDGRSGYRRISTWPSGDRDGLDRRVASLVQCARSRSWQSGPQVMHADLQRVRERADSLRVVIARRALEHDDVIAQLAGQGEALARMAARGESLAAALPELHLFSDEAGGGPWVLRLEDQLTGRRGIAGAEVTPLEPELAEYFRNAREGLLVIRVAPDSPSEGAGLRPGDVITHGDGRRLESVAELREILAQPDPGPLELRVVRKGRARLISLPRP